MGKVAQFVEDDKIDALIKKATDASIAMDEACREAGINYVTWWRWTKQGRAPLKNFRKVEKAVDRLIAA